MYIFQIGYRAPSSFKKKIVLNDDTVVNVIRVMINETYKKISEGEQINMLSGDAALSQIRDMKKKEFRVTNLNAEEKTKIEFISRYLAVSSNKVITLLLEKYCTELATNKSYIRKANQVI